MNKQKEVIKFKGITKSFGKLVANDNISFNILNNEVHAILGENGAGKSTLMSILFGLYTPDSGTILINGQKEKIKNPKDANKLGISLLPQHFVLAENMTVWENIVIGTENAKGGFLSKRKTIKELEELQKKYDLEIDLKSKIYDLSISEKQKVQFLRILWVKTDIFIFDEPTSILTPAEIERFLGRIRDLKKAGKTVVFISHKLDEIKAIADRCTIIRKGKYIDTVNVKATPEKKLAELMVGKAVDLNYRNIPKTDVDSIEVLKVHNLKFSNSSHNYKNINDISFTVRKKEIVGIASIEGNGESELVKLITGLLRPNAGTIMIDGVDTTNRKISNLYYSYSKDKLEKPSYYKLVKDEYEKLLSLYEKEISRNGKKSEVAKDLKRKIDHHFILLKKPPSLLAHIPEDRHEHGLVLDLTNTRNAILQDVKFYKNKFGLLNSKAQRNQLDYLVQMYDIRGADDYKTKSRDLSGGNQQKLILAREIERESKLIVAAHPTRGLDVGAIRNVYENLVKARNKGAGILLSSGELDEVIQVSDRIIVLHKGKIAATIKPNDYTKYQIGLIMSTGKLPDGKNQKAAKRMVKAKVKAKTTKKTVVKKATPKAKDLKAPKKVTTKKVASKPKVNNKEVAGTKYVVNHNGKWAVKMAKAKRVSKSFNTQAEAVEYAASSKTTKTIMIQSKNGSFRKHSKWDHDQIASKPKKKVATKKTSTKKATAKKATAKKATAKKATAKKTVTKKAATKKKQVTKKPTTKKVTTKKPVTKKKTKAKGGK